MSEQFHCHECSHLGVSGTTKIFTRRNPDGQWEARMGIALIGSTNMDFAGYEAAQHNPFHEKFYDNYAKGLGASEGEALEALKEDVHKISESLWI